MRLRDDRTGRHRRQSMVGKTEVTVADVFRALWKQNPALKSLGIRSGENVEQHEETRLTARGAQDVFPGHGPAEVIAQELRKDVAERH